MVYLAFFYVDAYTPTLISTQAALSLLIQSISPFLIGLQILRLILKTSDAYHNNLKDVAKI